MALKNSTTAFPLRGRCVAAGAGLLMLGGILLLGSSTPAAAQGHAAANAVNSAVQSAIQSARDQVYYRRQR